MASIPISPPTSAAPVDPTARSTKFLPTLPSRSNSPSTSSKTYVNPSTSILNISFPTSNFKRDQTLASKPDKLPFASAAFAELHRRRASSAKAAIRSPSHLPPPPPLKASTRPASPAPPPLPPKHEMLHFPNGARVWASSINTLFAATSSVPGSSAETRAPRSLEPRTVPTSSSNGVAFLSKSLRSKIVKRMTISTLPARSSPNKRHQTKGAWRSRMMRTQSRGAAISHLDPSSSDEERSHGSESVADGASPSSPYRDGAADADDESDGVVQYAEKAIFRRPVMVYCSAGKPKVHMKEVLETGPPEADSRVERGQAGNPVRFEEHQRSGKVDDTEAEERLERRLAEDRAMERRGRGCPRDSNSSEEEAEIQWNDVVYDKSIVDEHLNRKQKEGEEEEEEEEEMPGSAMSELDLLVRDSLLIAHDSSLSRPGETLEPRQRRVSFTKPLGLGSAPEHKKRFVSIEPSTPYPLRVEEDDDEPYGFKVNMKVAPEQWEMNEFGGAPLSLDGDKALKVLGLVEADKVIGLD